VNEVVFTPGQHDRKNGHHSKRKKGKRVTQKRQKKKKESSLKAMDGERGDCHPKKRQGRSGALL